MILYHGSNVEINKIELLKSKPFKDFGRGFYLSADLQQAEQMASLRTMALGGTPIVTSFSFDERKLSDGTLRYLSFDSYSEEWAKFVFKNREESEFLQDEYDVIYGPIANDKIGLQMQKLTEGSIDMGEFLHRIQYFKGITFQYFFGTERSISHLSKL